MAKVGNEAKLILRLAEERMAGSIYNPEESHPNDDYRRGWRHATNTYRGTLNQIVEELEAR